ncbi:YIP1 family protein [Myxococcus stipitatus]|uniref:YIP1 family protein n=1 Tax=Myxococcus stipitatus TaxID=83455 RepID=UPI003145552D
MVDAPAVAVLERSEVATGPEPLPWARRAELGLGEAFRLTCKEVILRPRAAFERMGREGTIGGSLLFAWLAFCAGALATTALLLLIALGKVLDAPTGRVDPYLLWTEVIIPLRFMGAVLVLAPIATLLGSVMDHLMLWMFGVPSSFRSTLRAHALSQGVSLIGVVPVFSLPVMLLWCLGLRVMAYRKLYRLGWVTPVAVMVLPWVVLGLLGCATAVFWLFDSAMRENGLQ